jgi:phospholipase C
MSKFKDSKPDSQLTILLNNLKNNPSTVPKVSWIVPGRLVSEHPGQAVDVRVGQAYVTTIVKAIMSSSIWNNCAIFISWDDWGGHYDHVIPPYSNPSNDNEGWGIRVPGIMLSPFAKKASSVAGQKRGWVDHEQYSHDAYLKLIEDLFCGSQRISGDGRTIIRENMVELGNLLNEFDFTVTDRKNTQAFRTKLVCKNY